MSCGCSHNCLASADWPFPPKYSELGLPGKPDYFLVDSYSLVVLAVDWLSFAVVAEAAAAVNEAEGCNAVGREVGPHTELSAEVEIVTDRAWMKSLARLHLLRAMLHWLTLAQSPCVPALSPI